LTSAESVKGETYVKPALPRECSDALRNFLNVQDSARRVTLIVPSMSRMSLMQDARKFYAQNVVEFIAFENVGAYSSEVFLTIESPASLKSLAGLSDAGLA
jgi:hypothetical protein